MRSALIRHAEERSNGKIRAVILITLLAAMLAVGATN